MTVRVPGEESEGAILVMKPGNSGGAKGPCQQCVFARDEEIRLDDNPTTDDVTTSLFRNRMDDFVRWSSQRSGTVWCRQQRS
jgi:hypothetical protein